MTHPVEEMWTPPPRQRRPHPIARRVVLISVALLVALVVTFIFVYQHAAAELDEQLKAEYAVTHYVAAFFVPTAISRMSYDDVRAYMSSFGRTFHNLPCGSYETPESFPGSQEGYLSGPDHFLALGTTILSPPDWEPGFARCHSSLVSKPGSSVMELLSIITSNPGLGSGAE
jgi:hypothetical protein